MPWRRDREPDPELDRQTVDDIIRILMRIDAKLDEVLATIQEDDDGEEEEADG
jgi:hypothetical protein